jgi:ribose transport system ATP-binding protein
MPRPDIMPRAARQETPAWEIRDLTKRFPGVVANDAVNLRLHHGEIHGLMGENGCGKSTLIKCLMGVHQPDGGEIRRGGATVTIADPTAARRAGISAVFQEFSLIPTLSVAENIQLGTLPGRSWSIDWQAMNARGREVLSRLKVDIDPTRSSGISRWPTSNSSRSRRRSRPRRR